MEPLFPQPPSVVFNGAIQSLPVFPGQEFRVMVSNKPRGDQKVLPKEDLVEICIRVLPDGQREIYIADDAVQLAGGEAPEKQLRISPLSSFRAMLDPNREDGEGNGGEAPQIRPAPPGFDPKKEGGRA